MLLSSFFFLLMLLIVITLLLAFVRIKHGSSCWFLRRIIIRKWNLKKDFMPKIAFQVSSCRCPIETFFIFFFSFLEGGGFRYSLYRFIFQATHALIIISLFFIYLHLLFINSYMLRLRFSRMEQWTVLELFSKCTSLKMRRS